jgi:hypothetical protein
VRGTGNPQSTLPVRGALAFQITALWMLQAEAMAHWQEAFAAGAAVPLTRPAASNTALRLEFTRPKRASSLYDRLRSNQCVHSAIARCAQ